MDFNTPFSIELRYIGGILYLSKESFDLFERLEYPVNSSEKEYIQNSKYFTTIKDALWVNAATDLAKLYAKTKRGKYIQAYDLRSLLESIKKREYQFTTVDDNVIEDWLNKLNENKNSIEILLNLRDKVYAHTEIFSVQEIQFDELFVAIKYLIQLATEIFYFLWCDTLGRDKTDFQFAPFDNENFDILKKLVT